MTNDDGALAPLTGDVTTEQAAASAEAHQQAASDAAAEAAQDREQAEAILAEARAEAARIIAAAAGEARVLEESADRAARQAAGLEERTRYLSAAAAGLAAATDADARASALQAEREQLAGTVAGLDGKVDALERERGQLAAQMDEARESGDLDALAALRSRDAAAAEVAASLAAQREGVLARVAEIGDGTENHVTHPLLRVIPPLAKARQAAEQERRSARQALNLAWPARAEAVADEERRLTLEAWYGDGGQAPREPQPRTFVRL